MSVHSVQQQQQSIDGVGVGGDENQKMKLIVFRNNKCRLMGCKSFSTFYPGQYVTLNVVDDDNDNDEQCRHSVHRQKPAPPPTVDLQILSCMSGSMTFNLGHGVNLIKLSQILQHNGDSFIFEPEIFPALRLTKFNPLCVNIFSSGKCVILGLTSQTNVSGLLREVKQLVRSTL